MWLKQTFVLAESYKFVREYPPSCPEDLSEKHLYSASVLRAKQNLVTSPRPMVDYTLPGVVSLLFTDLGILTPNMGQNYNES